ncbi:hypothetical protein [Paenibacillus solani]|uniref:hypothetical protein n=1 Tax=Paenibacillus solani TaxID=1705565 RepID=UPI003D27F9E0
MLLIIWKIYVIIRMILHPMFWLGLLYNTLLWGGFIYVLNHSYEIHMGDKLLIVNGVAALLFFFTSRTFRRPYAFCIATLGIGAMMLADSILRTIWKWRISTRIQVCIMWKIMKLAVICVLTEHPLVVRVKLSL